MVKVSQYHIIKSIKEIITKILKYKDARKIEMVFIKDNMSMEKDMEKVNLHGIMDNSLKACGKMVKKMVLGPGNHQKEIIMKEIG